MKKTAVTTLTRLAILSAVIIIMSFTPLGYLQIGPLALTFLTIPVAVGAVVMNRLRSGVYPSSLYDVIYQSGQFTPAGNGKVASVISSGVSGSCLQAAQEALSGVDNTGGALSFRRASSGQAGVVIGNHVFF